LRLHRRKPATARSANGTTELRIQARVSTKSSSRLLTVKLRGRTEEPARRRGRTLPSSARGANQTTHHGPLQRLLEFAPIEATVRARIPRRKPCIRLNEIAALSTATAAANAAEAEPSTDHPKQCPHARGMSSNEVSLP
jgi:hypothetical protein